MKSQSIRKRNGRAAEEKISKQRKAGKRKIKPISIGEYWKKFLGPEKEEATQRRPYVKKSQNEFGSELVVAQTNHNGK